MIELFIFVSSVVILAFVLIHIAKKYDGHTDKCPHGLPHDDYCEDCLNEWDRQYFEHDAELRKGRRGRHA